MNNKQEIELQEKATLREQTQRTKVKQLKRQLRIATNFINCFLVLQANGKDTNEINFPSNLLDDMKKCLNNS